MKRGTLTKNGKPTRLAVELYVKYFELGGKPDDQNIHPLISERIQNIMQWKDGQGIVCLLWGLRPKTINSKQSSQYHIAMCQAKNIAWDIYTKCHR